ALFFFFQAEDGIRVFHVTGVQTCALPISLRTLTVSRDVKAAVLYAAMSGDERRNFEAIQSWSGGRRGKSEVTVPDEALIGISPKIGRASCRERAEHDEDAA